MGRTALIVAIVAGCTEAGSTPPPAGEPPVAVRTVEVAEDALPVYVHGAGTLAAAEEVTLSFAAGGVLARIEVQAGDRVRRGQLLAVLDATATRSQLDSARSALEKAERDLARAELLEGTVLARQQREDAATGLSIAQANVEAARFAVRRAALAAPADGVVIERYADPNQTVGAGAPVLRLATDSRWELEIALAASDALRVETGLAADVRFAAYPGEVFTGQVVRKTGGAGGFGTFRATIAVDPSAVPLASGLVGAADLAPVGEVGPVVPLSALAEVDGTAAVVYGVDNGVARRIPVRIASFADDRVALVAPVPTVRVVDLGTAFIRDGAPVAEVQ